MMPNETSVPASVIEGGTQPNYINMIKLNKMGLEHIFYPVD